ncbi:uncharacterized protein LOC109071917 [Cyprinus carpio]|uniref:non-specific serine/threonine protein kinase n=1 Tax=Cyprinus carpio TaxID=7962 RepID=A0A9R0BG28_CYPCA|nr:uncharacterized protein LOC109071917 [Cyprinus carpio]
MGLLRKLLNRLCNLLNTTPVQEPQPHPGQVNETPVRACEVHGDSEAKREKSTRKRKRFWRWHSRRKMYSVAKTERQNLTHVAGTGTYRRHSQSIKEVVPIAEYQLEQEILQPAVLDSPGHSSADNDTDAPVPLSADGRFDSAVSLSVDQDINSAVSPKAERDVACAISTKVDGDVACAVSPKVDGDVACAVSTKVDGDVACAVSPKVDGDIVCAFSTKVDGDVACAVSPKVDGDIVCAFSTKVDGDVACAVSTKVDGDVACTVSPKVDGDVACAVSTKVDGDVACAVSPKVDGDIACAVSPKVDGDVACAVSPKIDGDIVCAVSPKIDGDIVCAVSPKVDGDVACAVSTKVDGDVACAVSPKVDGDIACAVSTKVDGDIACAVSTKVDKGIDSAGHAKKYKGIASAGRPKVDGGVASAVCTQVDGITNSVPAGELDKDHICCRYKFGGRLGEGGFGSVRKGIRLKDGLKVAVKYVRKTKRTTYITTAFHPKPLPLEIALAVMVNREPNCQCIIKLLDWQDDPDHYLIVMERLVPSMDMRTFLKCSGGILREQTAQYIMWQIIYAANFCCNRGIFHRDIKLANLIVNPTTLEIKLIDFGCGDLMKDSGYSTYSGTKPYFPPEYHDRGRYHAKPATVFSLGVLLFGMLHGRFPTAKDLHCLGNNRSVFAVSKECILFLWACLQRHPERRILLEQMLYDDWFVLGFPNGLPYNRNASNQHSHHR